MMKCWQVPSCAGHHSFWVHECNSHATCMRQCFTAFFLILWLLHSFGSPLLGCFLSLGGTVMWMSFEGWAFGSHLSSVTVCPVGVGISRHPLQSSDQGWGQHWYMYTNIYLEGSMTPFLFSKTIVCSSLGLIASQPWAFDQSKLFLIMEQKVEMLPEWALGSTCRFCLFTAVIYQSCAAIPTVSWF